MLTFQGAREMAARVQSRGSLWQTREKSGFGQAQIDRRFSKIIFGGGSDPDARVPVIHPIEISLKDLRLVPDLLQPHRLHRFDQLASKIARPGLRNFDQLLRNRARPGNDLPMADGIRGGAQDRERIDAMMRPEAFVLRTDRGSEKVRRE